MTATTYKERFSNLPFLWTALIALTTYTIIILIMSPNTFSPIHQDDYLVLGDGYRNLNWLIERPVSTNFAYMMGEWGQAFSYLIVNVITAIIPAMILYFVAQLFSINIRIISTLVFFYMVYSHPATFEHGKYLGLITNLISHFLGCAALLALLSAWKNPNTKRDTLLAFTAYALSVFAKEDFIIPPLLLLIYFGSILYFPKKQAMSSRLFPSKLWWLLATLSFVGIAVASLIFNFAINNPFLAGIAGGLDKSANYAVGLSTQTVYKLMIEWCRWYTIAAMMSGLFLWLCWRTRRRELFLLFTLLISIVLPYALLPNHIFPYRVFAWLPWLATFPVLAFSFLWDGYSTLHRNVARTGGLTILIFMCVIAHKQSLPRLGMAEWYQNAQKLNRNMTDSLATNRAFIENKSVVGVVGLNWLSPWSNNAGGYLRKLGYNNKWIVFVDKSSMYYTINQNHEGVGSTIAIYPLSELCKQPELMVLAFDATGVAHAPTSAATLCKRAT